MSTATLPAQIAKAAADVRRAYRDDPRAYPAAERRLARLRAQLAATPARSTLSVVTSAVSRCYEGHMTGLCIDAAFDAGEFSGPAHVAMLERELPALVAAHGWTVPAYNAALEARTSPRWAFFSGLTVDAPQD